MKLDAVCVKGENEAEEEHGVEGFGPVSCFLAQFLIERSIGEQLE